jgi:hypothetical protein
MKLVFRISEDGSEIELKHCASSKTSVKAIFHCGRFARAGGATNFNHVKNQSRGHAKKVECSSTSMACPRAFRRTKNAQVRQLQRKLSNVRSARAERLQWKIALKSSRKYFVHLNWIRLATNPC